MFLCLLLAVPATGMQAHGTCQSSFVGKNSFVVESLKMAECAATAAFVPSVASKLI